MRTVYLFCDNWVLLSLNQAGFVQLRLHRTVTEMTSCLNLLSLAVIVHFSNYRSLYKITSYLPVALAEYVYAFSKLHVTESRQ